MRVLHVEGEAVEDAVRRLAGDQPVEDAPSVDAEDVRQDAAEAQAVVVEGLVDSVASPAPFGDEGPAVPSQRAQLAEPTGRDEAGLSEAELTDASQPQAVADIGLLAADLLDGVGIEQVGVNAGVFQRLERGLPVDAGPFQGGGGDPCDRSQSVIARSPSGSALNSRTAVRARLRPASHRRTAAVMHILWTSSPAARGQTTCMSSRCKVSVSILWTISAILH